MEIKFIPSVFFTLFLVVDPLGLIPIFVTYLPFYSKEKQKRIIFRSTTIAIIISLVFILLGDIFLKFLQIAPSSFLIAGGILLFLIAMDMLFSKSRSAKTFNKDDIEDDISVFPLAIPMLCGPGNIAALLLFSSQYNDTLHLVTLSALSISVFIISMIVMFLSLRLHKLLRETGISVIQRIMGIILSAMAVQFIINGLRQIGVI